MTRHCENEMVKKRTARRSLTLRTLDVLFDLVVYVLTRPCENEMVKKRSARRSLSLRTTFKRTARQGEVAAFCIP